MFEKFIDKKIKQYVNELELSKENKIKIDKKLDPLLKNKKCLICKSKKVYMDGLPLKIKVNGKLTKQIFYRHLFIRRYCKDCGFSQFFDLNCLGIEF